MELGIHFLIIVNEMLTNNFFILLQVLGSYTDRKHIYMPNFTSTNLLLHAKEFTYPPIKPLVQHIQANDILQEEISFFEDFAEEFTELMLEPNPHVMNYVLSRIHTELATT